MRGVVTQTATACGMPLGLKLRQQLELGPMSFAPHFNYIITIHNKEDILEDTLSGVANCCTSTARIFPVLDGCSDRSEDIVRAFVASSGLNVQPLHTPDVHEVRTINAALERINSGFTIVLQDDVVLREPEIEKRIIELYDRMGPKLGVVSLRLAANVRRISWTERLRSRRTATEIRECDLLQRVGDDLNCRHEGDFGQFHERMVAIKGPNCIPPAVHRSVGLLDEAFAPFSYDEHDYCLRAMKSGFVNGLFPLRFESQPQWGGTRRDPTFAARALQVHRRNRRYLWQKHGEFISRLWQQKSVCRGSQPAEMRRAA